MTQVSLDDKQLEEAVRLGKHKTRAEAAAAALSKYIEDLKRPSILDLFGKVEFDPAYDYKAERRRDGCES